MAPTLAASPAEESKDPRLQQFLKTKMCKFHLSGMCAKGITCMFAHSVHELQTQPDLRCTKLCKRLIGTGMCRDRNCNFAHHADELRTTGTFHKTKLCKFNQICNFAHSPLELQQVEAMEGLTSRSAKVQCADEALLDTPPGLGEEDRDSASLLFYPNDEVSESLEWIAASNPAYVTLPGSYSTHANPFAYGYPQDKNVAYSYGSLPSMWGVGARFGADGHLEVDQADDSWQEMSEIVMSILKGLHLYKEASMGIIGRPVPLVLDAVCNNGTADHPPSWLQLNQQLRFSLLVSSIFGKLREFEEDPAVAE